MKARLNMTKQEFFDDTIKHFNSNNRGTDSFGGCSYEVGCAIGRHIKDKELCQRLDEQADSSVTYIFDMLPFELQELGVEFLVSMQSLHDDPSFWDEEGLSAFGEMRAKEIAKEYGLTFKK